MRTARLAILAVLMLGCAGVIVAWGMSRDAFLGLAEELRAEVEPRHWMWFDPERPETLPEQARKIVRRRGFNPDNFVRHLRDSRNQPSAPWKGLGRLGMETSATGGNYSKYSDVYILDGCRISPGDEMGWAQYDIFGGPEVLGKRVGVRFIWTDNAWSAGTKTLSAFDWQRNSFAKLWSDRTNDGREHVTQVELPARCVRPNDGLIRVRLEGAPSSVIHVRRVDIVSLEAQAAPGSSPGVSPSTRIHVVKVGETAWSLSGRTQVGMTRLGELNPGVDLERLKVGIRIQVPTP